MKIAMIGQKGIPSRAGGVEIHVEEISKRLVKKGHEVDVYCRKSYCDSIHDDYKGINLRYIPSINTKSLDALSYTFLATISALSKKYDVYHYHALGPSTLSFLPRSLSKNVVCTVHGLDWQREKWGSLATKYLKFGEFATANFSTATITLTNSMKNYYKSKHNKGTHVIPNGVYPGEEKPVNIVKEKYELEKNEYILFLARLVPEKGAHYLIDAFKKINTGKKLVIAGGSSHTDDYVSSLHDMAKGHKNIVFTGFVSGDIFHELFSNAYLYVLPSEIEGLPISLLEAMSYGRCCLVSDIPENIETIQTNGFSFKNKNAEDLYNNLQYLINNERIVFDKGQRAKTFVLERYNWDLITDMTENVYKKVHD